MKHEEYTKKARMIAKHYRRAIYNKRVYGEYLLADLTNGLIPQSDEESYVKGFEAVVEELKNYPEASGIQYYNFVKNRYMVTEPWSVEDLSRRFASSRSLVYRRIREAMELIGEYLEKEVVSDGRLKKQEEA